MRLFIALLALASLAAASAVPTKASSNFECDACHFVMGFIDGQLANNHTIANIEAVLEKVCVIVPPSLQGECTSLISSYFQELVQIFLKDENVDTVCNQLGLCSSDQARFVKLSRAVKRASVSADPTTDCVACEIAMSFAASQLEQNATQEDVIHFVENVCADLPQTIRDVCNDFIVKYGPKFMNKLASDVDPDRICADLGACPPAKTTAAPSTNAPRRVASAALRKPLRRPQAQRKPVHDGSISSCSICEYIVAFAENIITANSTETDIEKLLDDGCNLLGKEIAPVCQTFVSTYVPQIFSNIMNKDSPDDVCTNIIKICPMPAPTPAPTKSARVAIRRK